MSFWDLVYPKKCLGCGQAGRYFCADCLSQIALSDECFNNHLSLFCYRGVMREAVKKLKFRFLKDMEDELKALISSGVDKKLTQPNTRLFKEFLRLKPRVQPLPLFWYRQNWRGFNQAEMVGKIVAAKLKLKTSNCLDRIKFTQPQSRLKRGERLTNVSGIFAVKPGKLPRAILLVDDVWTTGATLREAMKALKNKGVKQIWGLSLAR
jgi:ComF family protein